MAEQATTEKLLVNNQPNIKVYTRSHRPSADSGLVTETLTLKPGANRVDPAKLAAKEFVQQMREDVEAGRVVPMSDDITKLRPDEALRVVDLTIDRDILQSWQASERRDAIKAAIGKQLTEITGVAH